jgi:long-chain fatty acid transport protein
MQKLFVNSRLLVGVCLALEIILGPAFVSASPLLEVAGDTLSEGGLQPRTVPGGGAAAYFNPALLTESPPTLTVGLVVLRQDIGITPEGRPGTEFAVPEGVANANHADNSRFDNYPIPTNLLQYGRAKSANKAAFVARPRQAAGSGHQTFTYAGVGLNVHLFDDHLAVGFHGLMPMGQFTALNAFFNDEREQYFTNSLHPELYSDRMRAISIGLGAGVKITDDLSVGAGATIALLANVGASAYVVDSGALDKILIDMNAPVNVGVSPHFGVSYRPLEQLRLSATAHAPKKVELGTKFTFLLANGVQQASGMKCVLDYMPWIFGLGAAYSLSKPSSNGVTLVGSLLYSRWSSYMDRHGERPSKAYAWSDTLSPTLGARYQWNKLTTSADLSYSPSPVPEQSGRTNYVDNDRVSGDLGGKYKWNLWGTEVSLGAQLQMHYFLLRRNFKLPTPTSPDGKNIAPDLVKDEVPDDAQISGEPVNGIEGLQTNNPGWPGFKSTGFIFGGSIYAGVSW